MQKKRVGIICGGQSVEHEVSVVSAKSIFIFLDRELFSPRMIGVNKQGKWFLLKEEEMQKIYASKKIFALDDFPQVFERALFFEELPSLFDVIFPIVHGAYGEDGSFQGLFRCLNIPYVGPNLSDAYLCFDKEVGKRLLTSEGVPVCKYLVYFSLESIQFDEVVKKLGLPVFVKPSNSGSSLGISKARNQEEFLKAVSEAFKYDGKVIIEEYVEGQEIECAVMGYKEPIVSLPGEIIPKHEFYSYEAKYLDEKGAEYIVPAKLDKDVIQHIQQMALKAYQALRCESMARVDFFLSKDSKLYINELNTLPGFTATSLFPWMWKESNISYDSLLTKLISFAFERHQEESKRKKYICLEDPLSAL